jgi:hypothetical protein
MRTFVQSTSDFESRRQRVLLGLGKALIDYRDALQRAKEAYLIGSASDAGIGVGLAEPLQR